MNNQKESIQFKKKEYFIFFNLFVLLIVNINILNKVKINFWIVNVCNTYVEWILRIICIFMTLSGTSFGRFD